MMMFRHCHRQTTTTATRPQFSTTKDVEHSAESTVGESEPEEEEPRSMERLEMCFLPLDFLVRIFGSYQADLLVHPNDDMKSTLHGTSCLSDDEEEDQTSVLSYSDHHLWEETEYTEEEDHEWHLQKHSLLGEGQFGQVWLVSEPGQPPIAMKVHSKYDLITSGQAANVIRERDILRQLQHPFIVQHVGSFQDDNMVYILQTFAQGGELFSLMYQAEGGMPEEQARFYATCIADALAYMHRRKIVYRDLKAENVMLDETGYPMLIDFGYAKTLLDEKTYTFCGTPRFLAPEVVKSVGHDYGVDHWALGVLVYEMLTGENPFYFDGMDETSLFRAIEEDSYPKPEGASSQAANFIAGLLVKDPDLRLGSSSCSNILEHGWLRMMDLLALRRKEVEAPWVPDISDAFDTSCFDDWSDLEDRMRQRSPQLTKAENSIFEDF